jgi:hypothetical protein
MKTPDQTIEMHVNFDITGNDSKRMAAWRDRAHGAGTIFFFQLILDANVNIDIYVKDKRAANLT